MDGISLTIEDKLLTHKHLNELISNLDWYYETQRINEADYMQIGLSIKILEALSEIKQVMRVQE